MILSVTLASCAAAAVIGIWMMIRIGQLRGKYKILHGDGGNAELMRRMRAQLNFVESVPFVLLLIAAIELSGKGGLWLAYAAAIFMLARVAHMFGMDSPGTHILRSSGVLITLLTLLGLAIYAVLIAAKVV